MIIHVVKSGDTLYKIAERYGVTVQKLVADNELTTPNALTIGQDIVVDVDTYPHTVLRGQTMWRIANMHGIDLQTLINANPQISNPNNISVGQVINIPVVADRTNAEVNGYAIANIRPEVLNKTLPYLTYLALFSYQAREDGTLYILYEQSLIDSARDRYVAPLMVVTNIGMSGGFDSDLAHQILNNDNISQTLINNIINTLNTKNYAGVDIDFEYIYPADRALYIQFLTRLKNALTPLGYRLSVAVAPKYRGTQMGILYEAHDYAAIGKIADRVIIMTYEWGYVYGAPMAVSPVDQIRQVLNYAVTVIPPEKILMGVPNYAYDWTLPYQQGTAATTLSVNSARQLAIDTGSTIMFDTRSQTPYFHYTDNGVRHVVWFENARSYQAKFELVKEYGLAGISYWTINNFNNTMYLVQNWMFNTLKLLN